jgi:hypothetical protein
MWTALPRRRLCCQLACWWQHVFMRTTVDIPDAIYGRLKSRAASEGRTAKTLILRGVKEALKTTRRKAGRKVALPIVRSKRPGSVELDKCQNLRDRLLSLTSTFGSLSATRGTPATQPPSGGSGRSIKTPVSFSADSRGSAADTGHLRSSHASEGQTTHPVNRVGPQI